MLLATGRLDVRDFHPQGRCRNRRHIMDFVTRKATAATAVAAGALAIVAGSPGTALAAEPFELFTVHLASTNAHDFVNVEFIYHDKPEKGSDPIGDFVFVKLTNADIMSFVGPGDAALAKSFMVIGEYLDENGGVGGVFIDVEPQHAANAIDTHIKLDSFFAGSSISLGDFPSLELKIANALEIGDIKVLDSLLRTSLASSNGAGLDLSTRTVGKLVEFSVAPNGAGALAGGTIEVSQAPVPEAATLWTMVAGLLALFGFRSSRAPPRAVSPVKSSAR
jgi:hypothetical protein